MNATGHERLNRVCRRGGARKPEAMSACGPATTLGPIETARPEAIVSPRASENLAYAAPYSERTMKMNCSRSNQQTLCPCRGPRLVGRGGVLVLAACTFVLTLTGCTGNLELECPEAVIVAEEDPLVAPVLGGQGLRADVGDNGVVSTEWFVIRVDDGDGTIDPIAGTLEAFFTATAPGTVRVRAQVATVAWWPFGVLTGECTIRILARAADEDGDGVINAEDNCPLVANSDQADADGDGIGDACDDDPAASQPVPEICDNGIDDDGDGLVDCDDPDCASDPACPPEPNGGLLPPSACFTFTPSSPQVGELVSYDAGCSTPGDGPIVQYQWDFNNDGIYDSGLVTTPWWFVAPGTHTVVLRVTDINGLTDETSQPVNVN